MLEAPVEDLRVGTGTIYVVSDRTKTITWKQATGQLGMESISEGGHWDEELRQGGAAGTQFAEVEVDTGNRCCQGYQDCRRPRLRTGN